MNETEEKILELLSKSSLTEDESNFISKSFQNDAGLKKYEAIFYMLRDMGNKFHLNTSLISEFVLYKNEQPLEDNSNIKLIPQIEKHLSECNKCKREFELLNEEFAQIDNYLSKTITGKKHAAETNDASEKRAKIFNLFTNSYAFKAAAVIAFFTFSAYFVSELTTPAYKNINELSDIKSYSATRGRVSEDFYKGINFLKQENFDKSINAMQMDLNKNQDDESSFYTNYMLGLIYLKKSESNFLGLFESFNSTDIDSSISNFKSAINKNNSGLFNNISYDADFYIGKGYLLQGNFLQAKKYFNNVIINKGSFSRKAHDLIDVVNNISK